VDDLFDLQREVLIIGRGSIATRYISILNEAGWNNITVAVSRESVAQTKDRFEFAKVISYEEICESDYPFSILCSRPSLHLDHAFKIRDTGGVVLIEKPLFYRQLDLGILSLFQKTKNKYFVSAPLRFHESLRFLRVYFANLSLESMTGFDIVCKSWLPDWRPSRGISSGYWASEVDGGVTLDLVHEIYYAQLLFKDIAVESSVMRNSRNFSIKSEDSCEVTMSSGDAIGHMRFDFITKVPCRKLQVDFPDGSIYWDLLQGSVMCAFGGDTVVREYPQDLNRNQIFSRQLVSVLGGKKDSFTSTNASSVEEANQVLEIVDEIRRKSEK